MQTFSHPQPKSISRQTSGAEGTGIHIVWNDGLEVIVPANVLRRECPCATCNQKRGDRSHEKPLTAGRAMLTIVQATKDEECNLQKIWPVGNYALGMRWADGHDSGIYPYSLLHRLSKESISDEARPTAQGENK